MSIAESTQYRANYNYIIGRYIKEYDLSKADIGILHSMKVIDEEQYQKYYNAPKKERNVEIGCYMKSHPEMIKEFRNRIKQVRLEFVNANKIEDYQILYVDNDSITIIDEKTPEDPYIDTRITKFDTHLEFKLKNVYTSFYRLSPLEFLYNSIYKDKYRIKYGGPQIIEKHKNGFLDFLLVLADQAEINVHEALLMLKDTYEAYTNHELPLDYYREFNSRSEFKLLPGLAFTYYTGIVPNNSKELDIGYNASLLRQLVKCLSTEFFKKPT